METNLSFVTPSPSLLGCDFNQLKGATAGRGRSQAWLLESCDSDKGRPEAVTPTSSRGTGRALIKPIVGVGVEEALHCLNPVTSPPPALFTQRPSIWVIMKPPMRKQNLSLQPLPPTPAPQPIPRPFLSVNTQKGSN